MKELREELLKGSVKETPNESLKGFNEPIGEKKQNFFRENPQKKF